MSASQDKKKRQSNTVNAGEKKQTVSKKKSRKGVIAVVTAAIAVVIAAVLVLNSPWLVTGPAAVSVGDTGYSVTDFNYSYYSCYSMYYNDLYEVYGDYVSSYMPAFDDLESTQYSEEVGTWADYFEAEAMEYLERVTMLVKEAEAAGFELTEENQTTIDTSVSYAKLYSAAYGYSTLDSYLAAIYGKGMDEEEFRRCTERDLLASSYATSIVEAYEYTNEELDEHYDTIADKYDYINYRLFFFSGSAVKDDESTEEDETMDEETAMKNAKEQAEEFAAQATSEEKFKELCLEYCKESSYENYLNNDQSLNRAQGQNMGSSYSTWLLDSSRKEGDVTVEEVSTGYYVLYFISREHNDYNLANMQYIQFEADIEETNTEDSVYEQLKKAAVESVKNYVDGVYEDWKAGEQTSESFAALYAEDSGISDITASGEVTEIYEDGLGIEEIEDWLFDSSRKEGDSEVFHIDDISYIVYYEGTGMLYNRSIAESDLNSENYAAWESEMMEGYEASGNWLLTFSIK